MKQNHHGLCYFVHGNVSCHELIPLAGIPYLQFPGIIGFDLLPLLSDQPDYVAFPLYPAENKADH